MQDIAVLHQPLFDNLRQTLLRGEWPLWNAQIFTGLPQLAMGEPAVFYPGNGLFLLFGFHQALPWVLALHHLLAGVFTYQLCRSQAMGPWGAALAGLIFAYGGVMVSMHTLFPLMFSAVWIPAILWQGFQLAQRPSLLYLCGFALVYGLQILSGHLELVYMTSLFLLVYYCLVTWRQPARGKSLAFQGLALLLALGLGAIQWLPSWELLQYSTRFSTFFKEHIQTWSLHPWGLGGVFIPGYFQAVLTQPSLASVFGEKSLLFYSIYSGLGSLILALVGMGYLKKPVWNLQMGFWIGVLIFSLLLALGRHLGLYGLALNGLPGFDIFRFPIKLMIFFLLALAVLAGWGLHKFMDSEGSETFVYLPLAVFGLVCLWLLFGILHYFMTAHLFALDAEVFAGSIQYWKTALLSGLIVSMGLWIFWWGIILLRQFYQEKMRGHQGLAAGIFLLLACELFFANQTIIFPISPLEDSYSSQAVRALQSLNLDHTQRIVHGQLGIPARQNLPGMTGQPFYNYHLAVLNYQIDNLNLNQGWYNAFGFSPAYTRFNEAWSQLYYYADKHQTLGQRNLLETLLAVKYIIYPLNPSPFLQEVMASPMDYQGVYQNQQWQIGIWENKNWQSRVHFKEAAAVVENEQAALGLLKQGKNAGFDPLKHVILEKDRAYTEALKQVPRTEDVREQNQSPRIRVEKNNLLQIELATQKSGYLILADQYFPGWQAYDNGSVVPILKANYFQRAIRLGPGKHLIEFVYRPQSVVIGGAISGLSGLILLLLLFWGRYAVSAGPNAETV